LFKSVKFAVQPAANCSKVGEFALGGHPGRHPCDNKCRTKLVRDTGGQGPSLTKHLKQRFQGPSQRALHRTWRGL
jgi:hypothetical protein